MKEMYTTSNLLFRQSKKSAECINLRQLVDSDFIYRICPVVVIMRCRCVVITVGGNEVGATDSESFASDAFWPFFDEINSCGGFCGDSCSFAVADWFGCAAISSDASSVLIFFLSASSVSVTCRCCTKKQTKKRRIKITKIVSAYLLLSKLPSNFVQCFFWIWIVNSLISVLYFE